MNVVRRLIRVWAFFLLWVLGLGLVIWIVWKSYLLFGDMASERQALRNARIFLAEGRRPAPARLTKDLHGEQNRDYWCFADGLCFYSIERFRVLYPTYNDLDGDDVLLAELHDEAGAPINAFDRTTSWNPVWSYLQAVIVPFLLVLMVAYGSWRRAHLVRRAD